MVVNCTNHCDMSFFYCIDLISFCQPIKTKRKIINYKLNIRDLFYCLFICFFQINRIRIQDLKQLFSLFEQVIIDFPKESEEEESVEDGNEEKLFILYQPCLIRNKWKCVEKK